MSCLPCMMMLGGNGMGALGITESELTALKDRIQSVFARVNILARGPVRDTLMKRIQGYNEFGFFTPQSITDDAYNQFNNDLNDIEKQAVAAAILPTFIATPGRLAPTGYGGAYMPVGDDVVSGIPNRWLMVGVIVAGIALGLTLGKGK